MVACGAGRRLTASGRAEAPLPRVAGAGRARWWLREWTGGDDTDAVAGGGDGGGRRRSRWRAALLCSSAAALLSTRALLFALDQSGWGKEEEPAHICNPL